MSQKITSQEKILINYYQEPIEKWFLPRKIVLPASIRIYNEVISFLSQKLNIGLIENPTDILNKVDRTYLDLNKDFGINKLTEILYEIPSSLFKSYYYLCEEILLHFKDHLIQRQPTIRIHFQDEDCYPFYPFWHSDPILGHPPYEKNIWIPLTKPNPKGIHGFKISNPEASSRIFNLLCKSSPYLSKQKEDLIKNKSLEKESSFVNCRQGEGVVFDSRIFHSATPYKYSPRISIDIRIMEKKYLNDPFPIFRGLGRRKIKFDSKNFFISLEEINSLKNKI